MARLSTVALVAALGLVGLGTPVYLFYQAPGAATNVHVAAPLVAVSSCTPNVANLTSATVETAIKNAAASSIVCLPAGSATWTTRVDVYPAVAANVTVMGQTSCTGAGQTLSCVDNTIITDAIDRSGSDPAGFGVTLPSTGTFRLSGITFRSGASNTWSDNGIVRMGPDGSYIPVARMDHLHFDQVRRQGWTFNGVAGVADHNRYDMVDPTADNATRAFGIDDDTRWNQATDFGTSATWFFVEDSYFANGIMNDAFSSSKQVFRYNYSTNSGIQQHGTGHAGQNRGARATEIYGNSLNGGSYATTTAVSYYTGGALVFNNSTSGFTSFIQYTSTRASNYTYGQGDTPGDTGYCGTNFNGTASVWDGNVNLATGYPCLDQVGRGIGDLLSGDYPTKRNDTRGCTVNFSWANRASNCDTTNSSAWPRQALEPAYEWSNTGTITGGTWNVVYNGPIASNVDYYAEHGNTSCNPGAGSCTAGVGVGTLAQRPANCTTGSETGGGVGWWATDQGGNWNTASGGANDGALYKCTATNTWTLYYTPYTYPHPLIQ